MNKNENKFNLSKSFSPLVITLILFFLFFFIIFLNSYLVINNINFTFNLTSLINFSLIETILVINFIFYLLVPFNVIDEKKSKEVLIIKKPLKKIMINYKDIFAIYSSSFSYSFLNNGYILLYLKNSKIIKIKYFKYPQEALRFLYTKVMKVCQDIK